MKLFDIFKSKCAKCPYTLGYVKFVVSPCVACKRNNYDMYYKLIKSRDTNIESKNKG